jgi:hypothetical protein
MNQEQIPQELLKQWNQDAENYPLFNALGRAIYIRGRKDQYLSQSSQPKGAEEGAGSAEEVLAEVIGEVLYSELTRRSAMPQYPTTQLQLILKAMQSYASQQLSEKDKEIERLEDEGESHRIMREAAEMALEPYKTLLIKKDKEIAELKAEVQKTKDLTINAEEFDKMITCLYLELPESIAKEINEKWALVKAELKKSQQPEVNRLGEIVGTFPDLPPYEKDNTTQQQPEVSEDWKNKFREFCASHEGNKSGDLRVMHVEAVINWIERNQLFEPQPVQGESDELQSKNQSK